MATAPSSKQHSSSTTSLKLNYALKTCYVFLINNFFTILLLPIIANISIRAVRLGPQGIVALLRSLQLGPIHILSSAFLFIFLSTLYYLSRPRTIFLIDYALYKPPASWRVPFSTFMEHARLIITDHPESVEFVVKILERSGLGQETCLPPTTRCIPPHPTMEAAREEARRVIFSAVASLLDKTGIKPKDIDILVVN